MTGFVVVALGAVVVVVVVGLAAEEEPDDDDRVVEDVVNVPEDCVVADDEWAVVSVLTSSPSPTALAMAAKPTAAVIPRTLDIARSRARAAGWLLR